MTDNSESGRGHELLWRTLLATGHLSQEQRMRAILGRLPQDPRCKFCHAPFHGIGGALVRTLLHKRPSQYNTNLCTVCEDFAREHVGGAEVDLGMLFADVRGSTTLAETISASEFSRLIDRFYRVASRALIDSDALIEKLVGDSVTGLYFPGFAGPDYVQRSIRAARELLRATGHGEANGPWIPIGIGLHHGTAFAGAVGSTGGVTGFTALGDAVNVAARLASQAAAGEIVISEDACAAAGLNMEGLERRELTLKGRSGSTAVRVLRGTGAST